MILAPLDSANALDRKSRAILSWAAADLTLVPRTGQEPSWTRDATRSANDFAGTAYTAVPHQEAWHFIDGEPTLYLGDSDDHALEYLRAPGAMSGLVEFYHLAGIDSGGGIFYIGNDGASGARFYIDWSGTQYRVTHNNGSAAVTSTMSGTAPEADQRVQLRFELFADGSVRLHQSIDGEEEASATASGANTLAGAWSAQKARLGGLGSGDEGEAAYARIVVLPGSGHSLARLEGTW